MDNLVGKLIWTVVLIFLLIPLVFLLLPFPVPSIPSEVMRSLTGNDSLLRWYGKIDFFLPLGFVFGCCGVILLTRFALMCFSYIRDMIGVVK